MPATSTYTRFSSILPVGGADLRLSELGMSSDGGVSQAGIDSITSSIAPTAGALTNLHDLNLATEAHWSSGGGMPTITILSFNTFGTEVFTHARQGSGSVVNEQIASATIEVSSDEVSWTTIHIGALSAAGTINTDAAWTPLATDISENISEVADAVDTFEDNMFFLVDSADGADTHATSWGARVSQSDTADITSAMLAAFGPQTTDAADCADAMAHSTFTFYIEAAGIADALAVGANTTSSLADSAAVLDVIQQAINQIVTDSADGADALSLGAALTLVDIADAVATQTPSYNSVMLVAELIATLEAYNSADAYDITESGALSDAYVARVEALVAMIEAAQAVDTNTALVHVMQTAGDSADSTAEISSAGSLLNALLNDAVLATIRLNIGGELFTGWVLNTETLAPSEYQFADLQFNSACKHGGTYLLAADDGIYQFTEDIGVETVMTYIKTGKTDFGSDLRKSVTDSYLVYSASGQMTLKVTTSLNGAIQTHNYILVPFASDDTTAPQRAPIGKGIKSRYWQFELAGADAGCTFDEIGMLPVVLSRRI